MDNGEKIALAIGVGAVVIGGGYLLMQKKTTTLPPSSAVSQLLLTSNTQSAAVGQQVIFTANAGDSSGSPVSGATVTFMANSASIGTATTDASGVASLAYSFSSAGTYTVIASA